MGLNITQVDAFTDRPFGGNPAAVCVLPEPGDERWMQNVAREMNLSETAFLYRQGDG
jgi:PhzF family phenazine biosynthesis protein